MAVQQSATLESIKILFEAEQRPEHFTDYRHCEECAEHNDTLKKYARYELPLHALDNPGWDPICFLTPQAFRYLFPRLCELAYAMGEDYYLDQFLFHLENNSELLKKDEKDLVYRMLLELVEEHAAEIEQNLSLLDVDRVTDCLALS